MNAKERKAELLEQRAKIDSELATMQAEINVDRPKAQVWHTGGCDADFGLLNATIGERLEYEGFLDDIEERFEYVYGYNVKHFGCTYEIRMVS